MNSGKSCPSKSGYSEERNCRCKSEANYFKKNIESLISSEPPITTSFSSKMPTVSARFNEQTLNDYSPLKDIKNVVKNLNKIVKEPLPKSDNNNILQISDCYISLGKYNTKLFMTFSKIT